MTKTEINTNESKDININKKIVNLKNANSKKKYKLEEITKNNNLEETTSTNGPKENPKRRLWSSNEKHSYIVSREKEKEKEKTKIIVKSNYNDLLTSRRRKYTTEKKINSRSVLTEGCTNPVNIERKLDKYIFNNKYFQQYIYFENLTNKELDFQKQYLETKYNNSKMFFKGYDNELHNNGKISRDEIYNSFLIIKNNISSKYETYINDESKKKKMIENVFKFSNNKTKEGKEVKSAMRKVLDKYILAQKTKKNKEKNNINIEEINKKNEFSIMKLNDSINEINYMLMSKNNEAKSNNNNLYTNFF